MSTQDKLSAVMARLMMMHTQNTLDIAAGRPITYLPHEFESVPDQIPHELSFSASLSSILEEVAAERHRQIAIGYTPQHDDGHIGEQIAIQAGRAITPGLSSHWVTVLNRRTELIRGIALAVAEVERLDRKAKNS